MNRELGMISNSDSALRRLYRKTAIFITILLPFVLFGPARPADAAACYATSCAGRDPISYGCSVTSTTAQYGALATVWNRYSAGCRANWARAQLTSAAANAGYKMWVAIDAPAATGGEQYMCWPNYPSQNNQGYTYEFCNQGTGPYSGSAIVYTDMVDGTGFTEATVSVFDAQYNLVAQYEADQ